MLPLTHAWSRTQKALIIVASLVAITAFGSLVYTYERSHRLPDESILVGTWEMITPPTPGSYTLLRLDRGDAAWHSGLWISRDITDHDGRGVERWASEISWYAGGSYVYMHSVEEPPSPQIWQIVDVRPQELRLRHAKRDYVFKRLRY